MNIITAAKSSKLVVALAKISLLLFRRGQINTVQRSLILGKGSSSTAHSNVQTQAKNFFSYYRAQTYANDIFVSSCSVSFSIVANRPSPL